MKPGAVATPDDVVLTHVDSRGVARISVNRPLVHNAWNPAVVAALHDAIAAVSARPDTRAVVLTGEGKSFSAGGDLRWMQSILDLSPEQRRQDAMRIGELFAAIDSCPIPVVARINGPAIAGGFGLACACDIAISSDRAVFALSEVRLGIVPAMIAPYVVRRLGEARARAHFLIGQDPMSAVDALAIGLVHHVVADGDLDSAVEREVQAILRSAPVAIAEAKRLFRRSGAQDLAGAIGERADVLVRIWEAEEVREGLEAFFAKRPPIWHRI